MPNKKNLLIIEQHQGHAEEIQHDVHILFDNYHIVNSISESITAIDNNDFDVVIVNPFFSDGNGRTFVEELHKNKKLYNIPIIVVSSLPAQWVKEDFYTQGADAYFETPYNKEEFYRTIQNKLRRSRQGAENDGTDEITGFGPREKFEEDYKRDQEIISQSDREGILGLIAPDGIDMVIREHGLETGDMLLGETANLVRQMCCEELQAVAWTHRSIAFAILDKSLDIVQNGLEQLRLKYIENMKLITKNKNTPGFHAILSPIFPDIPLQERITIMSNKLVSIAANKDENPVQYLTNIISSKKHILISDPDQVACSLVKHRVERDGFIPTCFSHISEIFTQVSPDDIAAILVDTMVIGGGINMVKEIKSFAQLSNVPVMIISRFGHENEIVDAFNAGAQDYLMKPFSMVELSTRIKRLAH